MRHVGRLSETKADDLGPYEAHCEGYRRLPIVDRAAGSVHQLIAVAELDRPGRVDSHLHAYEEGIYVLEGELTLSIAGTEERLAADDYVFIEAGVPHALANPSSARARWFELSAPQPGSDLDDPAFLQRADAEVDVAYRRGRFDESELPAPSGALGLAGFGQANVGAASLKMLIDRDFGASQFNLFVVQYGPGGYIKEHDHPFEEAFFFVQGEIEAVLDGETHTLRAGDYCWSGAASMHSFTNRSDEPVRWIETQVPQPPTRHQARFRNEWERLAGGGAG
jgi:quercetin dioxygenase-like cupin family protein